jgi:hypothetical protein
MQTFTIHSIHIWRNRENLNYLFLLILWLHFIIQARKVTKSLTAIASPLHFEIPSNENGHQLFVFSCFTCDVSRILFFSYSLNLCFSISVWSVHRRVIPASPSCYNSLEPILFASEQIFSWISGVLAISWTPHMHNSHIYRLTSFIITWVTYSHDASMFSVSFLIL